MKIIKGLFQTITGHWRSKAAGACVGIAAVHLMDGRPIWCFIVLAGSLTV